MSSPADLLTLSPKLSGDAAPAQKSRSADRHKGPRPDRHKKGPGTHRGSHVEGEIVCLDGEARQVGEPEHVISATAAARQRQVSYRFNLSDIEEEGRQAANTLDMIGHLQAVPARSRIGRRGEWDWSRSLCKAERDRLRSHRYTTSNGLKPDVFAEVVASVTGRGHGNQDNALDEWLRLTRVANAASFAKAGRDLSPAFGGLKLADLFTEAQQYEADSDDEDFDYEIRKSQDYFLMAASDSTGGYQRHAVSDKGYLNTDECFRFVYDLPRESLNIGFHIGFDKSHWLRDFTLEERKDFLDRDSRRYLDPKTGKVKCKPYNWRGRWYLDMMGQQFKLRPAGHEPGSRRLTRWRTVWDVGKQYQGTLLSVLDVWLPELKEQEPEVYQLIAEQKALRGGTNKDPDEQRCYSLAECKATARVHTLFRQVLEDHGIFLRRWDGAAIAKAMARLHSLEDHLPERTVVTDPETLTSRFEYPEGEPVNGVLDRAAYVGSRFEISAHGPVNFPIWQDDLTSAFPYQATQLPSWKGFAWEHTRSRRRVFDYAGWSLCLVSWEMPESVIWAPFPMKGQGNLTFPRCGYKRLVWSPEVKAAERAGLGAYFTVHEAHLLMPGTDEKPFEYVNDFYQVRAELDAVRKGRGNPIKVGLNSTYGMLAEQTTDTPRFQCLSWAGMIVSGVRGQVFDAIYSGNPADVVAIASDAIFSLVPRPDLVSNPKRLGGWEETYFPDGYFMIQSGMSFPLGEGRGKIKSRGLRAKDLEKAKPRFLEAWKMFGTGAVVKVRSENFYGLRIGTVRPDVWNKWVTTTRELALRVDPKRRDPYIDGRGITRSLPIHVAPTFVNDVFGNQFVEDKALTEDQPDYGM